MKEITQKDLVRIFKDNYENKSDTRFVFLLGAGASVQSGISSANKLAKKWIEKFDNLISEIAYKTTKAIFSVKENIEIRQLEINENNSVNIGFPSYSNSYFWCSRLISSSRLLQ